MTAAPTRKVVGDEEGLHRDAGQILGEQVRIAGRPHGGREVGLQRGGAGRVVGVEAQQLDELARLRLHVDQQLGRLAGDHDHHVDALVADQLDERLLVREKARLRLGKALAEHLPVERGRRHRGAAAQRSDVDVRVGDLVHGVERRVGAGDEVDLLVVERHDDAQRPDHRAGFAVARRAWSRKAWYTSDCTIASLTPGS